MTRSNSSFAPGTRSGWATQVPSKPSVASRTLSSRTFARATSLTFGSLRLGSDAAMPPIPATRVQPGDVISEFVEDFLHLEGRQDRLDQHRRFDRALREAEGLLGREQDVVPEAGLPLALPLWGGKKRTRA